MTGVGGNKGAGVAVIELVEIEAESDISRGGRTVIVGEIKVLETGAERLKATTDKTKRTTATVRGNNLFIWVIVSNKSKINVRFRTA